MKTTILTLFVLAGLIRVQGQGIEFAEITFEAAKTLAKENDQLIFIDAYTTWCGPCKKMAKNVFTTTAAGTMYNANFINLKLDMEKGEGRDFARQYRVASFPSLFFIDGDGEIIHKSIGAMPVDAFVALGQTALGRYDRSERYEEEYNDGVRTYELVYDYIVALNRSGKSSSRVANEYLRAQDNLSTKENLNLIHAATTSVDSRIYRMLIEHRHEIAAIVGDSAVNATIGGAAERTKSRAIEFQSPDLLHQSIDAITNDYDGSKGINRGEWIKDYFDRSVTKQGLLEYLSFADYNWSFDEIRLMSDYTFEQVWSPSQAEVLLSWFTTAADQQKDSWSAQYQSAFTCLQYDQHKQAKSYIKRAKKLANSDEEIALTAQLSDRI